MLTPLHAADAAVFFEACTFERVFGSKIRAALTAYGLDDERARFFLCRHDGAPSAALYLAHGVLMISSGAETDMDEIAALVRAEGVTEVDINFEQCELLRQRLGGTTLSSYYMVQRTAAPPVDRTGISPGMLHEVFSVLQRSHEYYRTHLKFATWAEEIERKRARGLLELYQLEVGGEIVGTGSIASEDEECGVVAAVAVVPEHRHSGLGTRMSGFLAERIREKGKTPRLISGYDEVAALYEKLGFEPCGRWGELYL